MRTLIRIVTILFLLSLAMSVSAGNKTSVRDKTKDLRKSGEAVVGKPAPWFSGWTGENKVVNLNKLLADPDAKCVALAFFATHCKPCRKGLEMLRDSESRLRKAGIKVVLVDFAEKEDKASAYVKELRLPFMLVLDTYGKMKGTYLNGNKPELPRTVLIGKDGSVRAIFGEEGEDYINRIVMACDE
ncbi:peroxiredoxin family protein [Thermodesulfobacteriota bacterium]